MCSMHESTANRVRERSLVVPGAACEPAVLRYRMYRDLQLQLLSQQVAYLRQAMARENCAFLGPVNCKSKAQS